MYILVEQRGYVVYNLYDQEVAIFMLMPEAIAFIKRQYHMSQQITISHKQHYPALPIINNYCPNQNAPILQNPYHQPPIGRQHPYPYGTSMVNGNMYPNNSNFVVNDPHLQPQQGPNPNLVVREKFEPTINMTNSMLNEQLFNEQEYRSQLNGHSLQQSEQKVDERKLKLDKFRQHLDDVVKKKQSQSNGTENKLGVNSKPSSFVFNNAKQSKINSSGTIDLEKADVEQKLKSGFTISNMDALQQGNEEGFIDNNKKIKTWVWVVLIILAVVIVGFGILGVLVGINVGGISDKIKELFSD
ncbi:hypothetical protein [Spiroplasma endosymbiont of Nephrotoma flavescens]|uniref:hypothetical protein n=1 Tax=Spiroplasma endosymbiont of Nephrotoma flavescens TaxID=3066302 RepID=UPI00313CD662